VNWRQLLMGLGSMYAGGRAVKGALDENRRDKQQGRDQLALGDDQMKMSLKPVGGIEDRCRHIVEMIRKGRHHPSIHKFVRPIVSERCGDDWCIKEKDYWGECVAVYEAVKMRVRYTADTYGTDLFQHPKNVLRLGAADCDDYSILLGSSLQAIGYPVKLRVIHLKGDQDWGHIYLLVGLPPRRPTAWRALDGGVVPKKPAGWEVPKNMVKRFKDINVPPG
jgi:predicted transglutaminase-like cysteine proteinase